MREQPIARLTWGVLLTTAPGKVLERLTGRPSTPSQRCVLRVLGSRHAMQAVVDLARRRSTVSARWCSPRAPWPVPALCDVSGPGPTVPYGMGSARSGSGR